MDLLSSRLDEAERRLALLEGGQVTQASQSTGAECDGGVESVTYSTVMKYLRGLQVEVSTLRRSLPTCEQVQVLRDAVVAVQCSVDVVKNKTYSLERQMKDANGHLETTRSSLLEKHSRLENAMGYSLGTELPAIRSDLKGLQTDLRAKQDSWLKEASSKLQAMQSMPAWFSRLEGDLQGKSTAMESEMKDKLSKMESRWSEKCSCFIVEVSRTVESKMEAKLDAAILEEHKVDVEAAVLTLREMLRTQQINTEGELKALRGELELRAIEARGLAKDLRKILVRGAEEAAADSLGSCTSYVVIQ